MAIAILLVDDSEIVTMSVRRWLERAGYAVVTATNCAEAKAAALQQRFAAHIIDLELSDGRGVDLALWLQEQGHVGATIFHTGHSMLHESLDRERGVGHIVTKGSDPATLLRVLSDRLG